jgi:hypothetical protein
MKSLGLIALLITLFSCSNEVADYAPKALDLEKEEKAIQNAILQTQQLLVGKLLAYYDSLDLAPAVRFCAENAQRLTDSMSLELGYNLRRLSVKNRNQLNAVNKVDFDAYKHFQKTKAEGAMSKFYFDELNQLYFAPIVINTPLCLQCHGKQEDRNAKAYELIQEYYPNDHAIDYALGDLRGVWRVSKP